MELIPQAFLLRKPDDYKNKSSVLHQLDKIGLRKLKTFNYKYPRHCHRCRTPHVAA